MCFCHAELSNKGPLSVQVLNCKNTVMKLQIVTFLNPKSDYVTFLLKTHWELIAHWMTFRLLITQSIKPCLAPACFPNSSLSIHARSSSSKKHQLSLFLNTYWPPLPFATQRLFLYSITIWITPTFIMDTGFLFLHTLIITSSSSFSNILTFLLCYLLHRDIGRTLLFFFFGWYWSLNSGLTPWAIHQPIFVMGLFKIASCELFAWAGFELWSSWSLPPE
jgi:hypothetical protein